MSDTNRIQEINAELDNLKSQGEPLRKEKIKIQTKLRARKFRESRK